MPDMEYRLNTKTAQAEALDAAIRQNLEGLGYGE
jgi:hypothetical protein